MMLPRTRAIWLAMLPVALALATIQVQSSEAELPRRTPGLWQLTSISAEIGMTTIEACIGPNDSIAAPQEGRTCQAPKVERYDDQVIVNVTCTSTLGEERISTLFTGDFITRYRGITKITFDPPAHGQGNMAVTVDAKYMGPNCPKQDVR